MNETNNFLRRRINESNRDDLQYNGNNNSTGYNDDLGDSQDDCLNTTRNWIIGGIVAAFSVGIMYVCCCKKFANDKSLTSGLVEGIGQKVQNDIEMRSANSNVDETDRLIRENNNCSHEIQRNHQRYGN